MPDSLEKTLCYEFGPFRLDPLRRLLLRGGEPVQLAPKALDTLLVLVEQSGRVVEKSELIDRLWPDSFVEEINLTVYISTLRKVLGESPGQHRYIVTVPRRGYSFVAEVREICGDEPIDEVLDRLVYPAGSVGDDRPSAAAAAAGQKEGRLIVLGICLAAALAILVVWVLISTGSNKKLDSMAGKSIAVLPFKLIGAEDQEYLEFGMADALITRLSRLDKITVRPTSSIFNYVGKNYDPTVAGRELGVEAVMQGTIQQAGDRVRVTLQLISTAEGKAIWADRFDERGTNVFAVQDSISEQVAQALSLKLTSGDRAQLARRDTPSTEAYQAYLKGIFFWNKRSLDSLGKSVEYFQQAVDLDSGYALAYAGLADAAALAGTLSAERPTREQLFERAKAAAVKAIAIDDSAAEAHIARALVYMVYENDVDAAEREQTRALELAPNSAIAHQRYGWVLFRLGQLDRAVQQMNRAVELDPLAVVNHAARSNVLYFMGQHDETIEACEKTLELDPSHDLAMFYLGLAYEQKGDYDRAIREIQRAAGETRDDIDVLSALGHVYAVSGRASEAQKIIRELKSLTGKEGAAIYGIALVHAGLGDLDGAFEWLEKGARARAASSMRFIRDPRLAELRNDSRFERFLQLLARN
jgi:TolB-like protein/DNA-binding winged helix-turn-helix (wHTH) protein/Tfp pilus assembly protein PilF